MMRDIYTYYSTFDTNILGRYNFLKLIKNSTNLADDIKGFKDNINKIEEQIGYLKNNIESVKKRI